MEQLFIFQSLVRSGAGQKHETVLTTALCLRVYLKNDGDEGEVKEICDERQYIRTR